MRRIPAPAALVATLALVAAGCGSGGASTVVPATVKAPPQSAQLGWVEPYPAEQPALVFGVSSFTVTADGWRAEVSVENRSDVGWEVGARRYEAQRQWGVLLFPNDDHQELEQRSRDGDIPAIRPATAFTPALPNVLRPGTTWRGTISAPGALAGGLWARISFGPFVSDGDPPAGAERTFTWITDHAYHLEEVAAEPA